MTINGIALAGAFVMCAVAFAAGYFIGRDDAEDAVERLTDENNELHRENAKLNIKLLSATEVHDYTDGGAR